MTETPICAVPGCERERRPDQVMCRTCWYKVPKGLQNRLWTAYRTHGLASSQYLAARKEAVATAKAAL